MGGAMLARPALTILCSRSAVCAIPSRVFSTMDVKTLQAENTQLRERVRELESRLNAVWTCMALEEEIEDLEENPTDAEQREIEVLQLKLEVAEKMGRRAH